jgi:hypothetical protein
VGAHRTRTHNARQCVGSSQPTVVTVSLISWRWVPVGAHRLRFPTPAARPAARTVGSWAHPHRRTACRFMHQKRSSGRDSPTFLFIASSRLVNPAHLRHEPPQIARHAGEDRRLPRQLAHGDAQRAHRAHQDLDEGRDLLAHRARNALGTATRSTEQRRWLISGHEHPLLVQRSAARAGGGIKTKPCRKP